MSPEDGRGLHLVSGRLPSVSTTSMDTGREERGEVEEAETDEGERPTSQGWQQSSAPRQCP